MNSAFSRLSLVGLGVGLMLAVTTGPVTVTAAPAVLAIPVPMQEGGGCDLVCSENPCPNDSHDAWEPTDVAPFAMRNGGQHYTPTCYSGTCDTKHGPMPCEPLMGEDLEALRVGILDGNAAAIRSVQVQYPTKVNMNMSRSAIQVVGCAGLVLAHFPVSTELMASVASTEHP